MSEPNYNEIPSINPDQGFWNKLNLEIFQDYLEGSSIEDLTKKYNLKKMEVMDIITDPVFLSAHSKYVEQLMNSYQEKRLKIINNLLDKLYKKVEQDIDKIPATRALMQLTTLLTKEETKTLINRGEVNFFKENDENNLLKKYGYKKLDE